MDIVATHAARHPDKAAIVDGEHTLSWRALLERRNRLAQALGALGLRVGQHVALHAHNSVDYLVASAASRVAGAVPVPVNHRLTADEVTYILNDAEISLVFVSEAFMPVAERVRLSTPSVRHWIAIGATRPA